MSRERDKWKAATMKVWGSYACTALILALQFVRPGSRPGWVSVVTLLLCHLAGMRAAYLFDRERLSRVSFHVEHPTTPKE
jgi:hypothetical protein